MSEAQIDSMLIRPQAANGPNVCSKTKNDSLISQLKDGFGAGGVGTAVNTGDGQWSEKARFTWGKWSEAAAAGRGGRDKHINRVSVQSARDQGCPTCLEKQNQ